MQSQGLSEAGPSRPRANVGGPRKPRSPFVSKDHRPDRPDGKYRVVLISSGSVASIKVPDIVGSLVRNQHIEVQVIGTAASLRFYDQAKVDEAARKSIGGRERAGEDEQMPDDDFGVKVWKDEDEWSDWKQVGDPILHIELRRWADLVLVAPCSADMLAKIAGGICDNLATSLLRALSPDTPTILFPAMNTHMYSHPLTNSHLNVVQETLGYMVSGPQGAGRLACGDEGPGKMTDWRDIVTIVEDMAVMHRAKFAEARIFRELGPGTSAQGFGLDMPSTNQSLASKGLSQLIAADQAVPKENNSERMNIHFSAVKDPLEYNNFQPGLTTEKSNSSVLKEPARMAHLPLSNYDQRFVTDRGWNQDALESSAQKDPTSDNRQNTNQPTAEEAAAFDNRFRGNIRDPLEVNGNVPGLSTDALRTKGEPTRTECFPGLIHGRGPHRSPDDPPGGWTTQPEMNGHAVSEIPALNLFGGPGKDQRWFNGHQEGLATSKGKVDEEPQRMGLSCLRNNDRVHAWGPGTKAPDNDKPVSDKPISSSMGFNPDAEFFNHFNSPRKPSRGVKDDLAFNNFQPGLKTDRTRSPDAEPMRMQAPEIDKAFNPPIGSMSFGRPSNPPKSPRLQPDGFRQPVADLNWNNNQPGLSTGRASAPGDDSSRLDVHLYTSSSGTLRNGSRVSEGESVIPRTAL